MVVYEDDYSKKKKNVHVVSMEVWETGEIIDYVYSNQKSKDDIVKEGIERRNTLLLSSTDHRNSI